DGGGRCRDLDDLLLLRDTELDIEIGGLRYGDFDTGEFPGFEAGVADRDRVDADGEIGEGILALCVGGSGAREARRRAFEFDGSFGYGCAGGVSHDAGDVAAESLCRKKCGE